MTKTAAVTANGRNFWAYDVSISFLAHEILEIGRERQPGPWFSELIPSLTGVAIVGGTVGLDLQPVVDGNNVEPFAEAVAEAGARLRALKSVTKADAEARRVEGHPVIWRRLSVPASDREMTSVAAMPTEPIADLACAVIDLLRGTLSTPPAGTWWFLGLPEGPRTITMEGADEAGMPG